MATKKIVIFGLADTAQLAHFYFTHDSPYTVSAFTVDSAYQHHDRYCNLPVVPFNQVETFYPPDDYAMFIAIGYHDLNNVRIQKYLESKQKGYEIVSYVSSRATIWPGTPVGENCFILENNLIQPFATIGNNVTIWSGNNIGHHSQIENNSYITSHVALAGRVTIKECSFIGVNAAIGDHVTIASHCIIAASALVLYDTLENHIYSGRPAKARQISGDLIKKIFKVQKRNPWELHNEQRDYQ